MRIPLLIAVACLTIAGLAYGLVKLSLATDTVDESAKRQIDSSNINASHKSEASARQGVVNDEAFHALLLHVAANYKRFGRVDDLSRFAPAACAAPSRVTADQVRFSLAGGETPHDRKLYYLYALNRNRYLDRPEAMEVGQAVVKESWQPVEVKQDDVAAPPGPTPSLQDHVAVHPDNQKLYRTGKQSSLFVMVKTDAKTPGTDQGWVYGTLTPNGKTVTSAGRVESCMECHISAKHDRMFGLPTRPWAADVLR